MPRVVKYDDQTTPSGSLRKGNMVIGPGNFDYGTSFYTAVEPPLGGYTIYLNKATGGPSIYTADSESELISITKEVSGTTYANTEECLNYYAGQTDKVVISSTDNIPTSVTDGLVLNLNAQSGFSYPTTGSTWYDVSGDGNNGTLINGPTFDENGAIVFDGVDDYVNIPDDTSLDIVGDLTLSCWLQTGNNINTEQQILSKCYLSPSQNISYRFYIQNSYFVFYLSQNGTGTSSNRAIRISTTVLTNTIYNVICIYTESEMNVYINGVLSNDSLFGTIPTSIFSSNSPLFLGAQGNTITTIRDPFAGKIFSSQIYNRALSAQEIKQNYFQAPIVTDGLVFNVDPSNLVSYENGSSNAYSLTGSISGSLFNGVGYSRNYGSYLNFDGANDWIQFEPDFLTSSGLTGGTPKTMEVWITCEFTGNNFKFMFAIGSPSTRNAFFIGRQFGSNLDFGAYGDDMVVGGFFADKIGVPVHLVLTYESGVARGYYNGDQIISANKSWSLGSSAVRLGRQVNSFGEYFAGKLFSARLYNKALSPDEIRQNFDAQRNRFGL